ncbi:CHC2 zinc finger domain-containing protein [uncultured Roseobacter sp.]|uniref:CHC2 zinc finger domain-containing protein n=1 Tax=uncultured Roseobacter sp. TaxID=114847 RepID=UPI0026171E5F|nr:CHC2 zinc finger domain-containing protein [uncultured Roseobacter sp.]
MSKTGLLDLVAIRNNTPFSDVLAHYGLTPEKPGGKQVKIRCPFHDDKTPSCSINQERGIFKCFGCPEKGNVLDFIALMEEITDNHAYQAALVALDIIGAAREDFEKPQEGQRTPKGAKKKPNPSKGRKSPQRAKSGATEEEKPAPKKSVNPVIDISLTLDHEHEFLTERGIDPETAEAFGIGYCGTGIMKRRIAIPIHNPAGELVAYSGRWADGDPPDDEPRYKLPKGFEKSLELFNLHRAASMQKQYVVVVEGYWSTLRLDQAGIPAVALMGTDICVVQAKLLSEAGFKYAILILDGDEAGRLATPPLVHVLSQELYVKTLVLPEGIKPDTMDESMIDRLRR